MGSKSKRKSKDSSVGRRFDFVMQDAYNAGAKDHCYENFFDIPDESLIRNIESKLSKDAIKALRLYLIGDMRNIPNSNSRPVQNTSLIIHKDKEIAQNTFASAVSMLIANILWDGETSQTPTKEIFEIIAEIEKALPDKFHDDDIDSQCQKHINQQFSDGIITGVHDLIDWETTLSGDNMAEWSANVIQLINEITQPERLQEINETKNAIISRYIELAAESLPRFMLHAKRDLAEMGLTPEPISAPAPIPSALLNTKNVFAKPESILNTFMQPTNAFLPTGRQPNILVNQPLIPIQEELEPAKPWMFSFLSALEFNNLDTLDEYQTKIMSEFSYADVTYTALYVAAAAHKHNRIPGIAENMMMGILTQRFSSQTAQEIISPKDDENILHFSPFTPIPYSDNMKKESKRIRKEKRENGEELTDKEPSQTSLWQIMARNTGVMIAPEFSIRLKWLNLLEDLGYSHDEACALCGYMEGTINSRVHSLLTNVFCYDDDDEEENGTPEETSGEPSLESILKDEYEAKINSLYKETNEKLDAERRKHSKRERSIQHEMDVKNNQIAALESQNAELQDKLADLEAKYLKLQDLVLQFDTSTENEDNNAEDNEPTTLDNKYPMDIGQDTKIIVFGGSGNWIARQQERFPNITFVPPEVIPNESAVLGADIIMVNRFVIKHKMFWPVQNAAKRVGKDIHFFPNRGINSSSQYIIDTYNAYCSERQSSVTSD